MKFNFVLASLDCVPTVSFCLNDTRFDSMIIYNLTVKDWLTTVNYVIDLVISAIHEK
jgi:hypothetical protein